MGCLNSCPILKINLDFYPRIGIIRINIEIRWRGRVRAA